MQSKQNKQAEGKKKARGEGKIKILKATSEKEGVKTKRFKSKILDIANTHAQGRQKEQGGKTKIENKIQRGGRTLQCFLEIRRPVCGERRSGGVQPTEPCCSFVTGEKTAKQTRGRRTKGNEGQVNSRIRSSVT